MDRKQNTVVYDKVKQWLPYILSGTSLAVSCYTLHLLSHRRNQSRDRSVLRQIRSPKIVPIESNSNAANEDLHGTSTLSRLMQPDDANGAGNVHGGTILKVISHTGWLSATRYINSNLHDDAASRSDYNYRAVLVRMESMDFKLPMHINEVCTCNARVSFTSNRSLEVEV